MAFFFLQGLKSKRKSFLRKASSWRYKLIHADILFAISCCAKKLFGLDLRSKENCKSHFAGRSKKRRIWSIGPTLSTITKQSSYKRILGLHCYLKIQIQFRNKMGIWTGVICQRWTLIYWPCILRPIKSATKEGGIFISYTILLYNCSA